MPSGATTEYFSPNEIDNLCESVTDISTRSKFTPSIERLSVVISFCHELIYKNEKFIKNINIKACGEYVCPFDKAFIEKIYSLFYPFNQIKSEDVNDLLDLLNENEFPQESLIFSLCIDPIWQSN